MKTVFILVTLFTLNSWGHQIKEDEAEILRQLRDVNGNFETTSCVINAYTTSIAEIKISCNGKEAIPFFDQLGVSDYLQIQSRIITVMKKLNMTLLQVSNGGLMYFN